MNQCKSCSLRTLPSALVWRILCALPAGQNTPAKLVLQTFCPLWYFFSFSCGFYDALQSSLSSRVHCLRYFWMTINPVWAAKGKGSARVSQGLWGVTPPCVRPLASPAFQVSLFSFFLLKRHKGRAELWLPVHNSNNGKPVRSLNRRNFNKLSSWVTSDHNTTYSFFNII